MSFCIPPADGSSVLADLNFRRASDDDSRRVAVPQVVSDGRAAGLTFARNGFELVSFDADASCFGDAARDVVRRAYAEQNRGGSGGKKQVRDVVVLETRVHDYATEEKYVRCDRNEGPKKSGEDVAYATVWRGLDADRAVPSVAFLDPTSFAVDGASRSKDRVVQEDAATDSLGTDTSGYKWYYFPDMTHREGVIFGGDKDRSVFHTAFELPSHNDPNAYLPHTEKKTETPAQDDDTRAPPRRAVEVRTAVFFED